MYKKFTPRKRTKTVPEAPAKPRKKHRPADHVGKNPRVIAAKARRDQMVQFAKTPVTRKQLVEKFKISDALVGYYLGLLIRAGALNKVREGLVTKYVKA